MKAENFASLILENVTQRFNDYFLIETLCFYFNPKKIWFVTKEDIDIIYLRGTPYIFSSHIKPYFDKFGIIFENANINSSQFNYIKLSDKSYRRIKPFLNEVRKRFKNEYGYKITFNKEGEVYRIDNHSNCDCNNLFKTIMDIAYESGKLCKFNS